MRTTVVVLVLALVAGAAFAGFPATDPTGEREPQPVRVKLYTGLPGSEDYFWGTAPAGGGTDAWTIHSEMPNRMMDHVAAASASHVYVAAGYTVGRVFYRHAIGSTTWETLTQCPMWLTTGGAAVIGDTFYYCGGYHEMSTTADTLFKYSISGNSWTSAPGPFAGTPYNWSPTVVACAGKLYYISGCAAPGADNPTRQVWCYTPGAGWSQKADMNQGRVFANAAVYRDTIWVTAGIANNVGLTHSEFYDPVANVWTVNNSVFPQLPVSRWGAAGGQAGSKMFVASGVDAGFLLSDTAFYFDFAARTWSAEDGMPLRVYRTAGAGAANGDAHVYGGSTGGFSPTDTVQVTNLGAPPSPHFLWLYSDYDDPDTTLGWRLRALGDTLTYMDVQSATPTLADLLPYAAVGAHSNYTYGNATALGNVLADYVDAGGGVVLGHFSFATGWGIAGRIITGDYATISVGSNTHQATTLGWHNAGHPVMAGVSGVAEYFAGGSQFVSTDSVARWNDGRPYVAVSANMKVVGVNSYPGVYTVPERAGDWALVFRNALHYAAGSVGAEEFDPFRPALNVTLETGPNPVRRQAAVSYGVVLAGEVSVGIYDANGRLVRSLFEGRAEPGVRSLSWDLADGQGGRVASGVYFCRLVTAGQSLSSKLVVE
ncbi:MAG: FlgD immunoglobulin-like domain containing protein [bacterium]